MDCGFGTGLPCVVTSTTDCGGLEVYRRHCICEIVGVEHPPPQDDLPVPQLLMHRRHSEVQSSSSIGWAVNAMTTVFALGTLTEGCQHCVVDLHDVVIGV